MSSEEAPSENFRRNASRLPSESKTNSLRPASGHHSKTSAVPQSKSEQDLSSRHWAITSEGFPPGVTVDELKKYRRRRQIGDARPKDNLQLEEGSLRFYQSEYKRRFRAYSPAGECHKESENLEEELDQTSSKFRRPPCNLQIPRDHPMESATEKNSQYVPFFNAERRMLLRKSTALKPEGDMMAETEVRSQFREYENAEKATPIRRPPSLKLEGDFETLLSEQRAKFISHTLDQRPILKKKNTLLKMEGEFDFLTEKQMSYIQHGNNERLRPRKRSTSLKLDGEVEFFPEYRSSFVDFPRSRPITYKPMENLRTEGDIESKTETKTKFIDYQQFPIALPVRPINNLQTEGGLEIKPEYRESFIDFPRSRPLTMRPESHLKQEGDFEMKTEKAEELSKILGEEVRRPLYARRPSNLKLEGDFEFSTEKQDKFKGYDVFERLPPARREGNLLLEGEFDFKTENEDKYVANVLQPPSDFRKKSSLLGGGFSSGRTSPRQPLSPNRSSEPQVRNKLIPYRTEYYGLSGELVDNCNRRNLRRNSKRLKENLPRETSPFDTTEKNIEGSLDNTPEYRSKFVEYPISLRKSIPPADNLRLEPLNYSHCQTTKDKVKLKDDTGSDTSDTGSVTNHQPSFRVEVYNVDANPQGFHRSPQRVFPSEGIPTDTISVYPNSYLEKKRNEYYERNVNCPDVPNYLLDKNNNHKVDWDEGVRSGDKAVDILNKNAAVLGVTDGNVSSDVDGDGETWNRPDWLTT